MAILQFNNDEFNRLRDDVNQLIEGTMDRFRKGTSLFEYPTADLIETDDKIILIAEIPGYKPEKVQVHAHEESITLSGSLDRPHHEDEPGHTYRLGERRRKDSFSREFDLPSKIDPNSAQAAYHHGLIEVTVQKLQHAKGKSISVKVDAQ